MERAQLQILESRSIGGGCRMTIAATPELADGKVDLANLQVDQYMRNPVVLYDHGHGDSMPVARTTRLERIGGKLNDKGEELPTWNAEFEFLTDDPFASRVKNAWDKGFLRAASIRWEDKSDIPHLVEWSITPVGLDPEALRSGYERSLDALLESPTPEKETGMTDDETQKAIADGIKAGLAAEAETRTKSMNDQFAEMKVSMDKQEAALKASLEKQDVPSKDPPAETDAEKIAAKQTELVEARADLLVKARSLLPKEFDTKGKTDREIMVASIGTALKDANQRSDGYLEATMDSIISQREAGAQYRSRTGGGGGSTDWTRENFEKAVDTRSISPEQAIEIAKSLQQQALLARSRS